LADIAIYLSFCPKLVWDAEENFSGTRLIIKLKGKREKAKVKKSDKTGATSYFHASTKPPAS
jgi:hypothetical protein